MKNLLTIALKASVEAGEAILKIYKNDFEVEIKSDNSPLTLADKNANDIINSYLQKTDIPIISEENKQLPYETRKNWETCWMVDPLDGTKEFVNRNDEFTVNIALINKNKPILGVIYVPVFKTLYYAIVEEKKAYKIVLDEHNIDNFELFKSENEIRPKKESKVLKVVGSRSHSNKAQESFIENLKRNGNKVALVSKGSSLKFCLLAEGEAQIYPRLGPTMEWDTAAGHAICKAVGLDVLKFDSSEEVIYNKENLLNPNFVVNINESTKHQ